MEYRILGPLKVVDEGEPVPFGRLKERLVLAILLLNANQFVSRERLIDELWGEAPPPTAKKAVNVYVSQLRKVLARYGHDPITTADGGYRLVVDDDELDVSRLRQLLARARERASAGELEAAAELLREALGLWRGPTLAGLLLESRGRDEIAQLDEFRLTALMDRIDCDIALGRHEEVLGELQVLVGEHPLRERLRAQLMLALYRADRQADALEAYQQARQLLVEELGIEPSPALQRLQQGILRHDPSLETASGTAAANGLAPTRPFREQGTALDEQPHWSRVPARRRYLAVSALVLLVAAAGLTALAATRASGGPRVVPNSLVRLNPRNGKPTLVVPVGVEPGPIAITPTAIWTSNYGDNTVSRYDLRTHTVDSRSGFPGQPYDIVVDGDRNAWITSSYEDHAPARNAFVTRLEAGTGGTSPGTVYPSHVETMHVPLPMAGFEALGAGYLWVIVGGHGPLYGDDRVALVDLSTNRVASVRRLHDSATSIAFGYGSAWIGTYTSGGNSWVEAIRAGSSKVTKVLLERGVNWGPPWIAVGEGAVWALTAMPWASGHAGPRLFEIDPQTLHVLHRLDLSAEQPDFHIAVGAGAVWTVNDTGSVTKIDPRTDRIIRTIPVGDRTKGPCGIAATPSTVWVAMGNTACDTIGR